VKRRRGGLDTVGRFVPSITQDERGLLCFYGDTKKFPFVLSSDPELGEGARIEGRTLLAAATLLSRN
jgi:hypothetical protein